MSERLVTWGGLGAPHGFETRHGSLADHLPGPPLLLQQVHGNEVHVVDARTDREPFLAPEPVARPCGDALVTDLPGVTIAVLTADCVPVLFHDPERGVVAAAHAGWRGIAAGVVPATLTAMRERFGTSADDCRAAIGPCVGADAYRVGPDVRQGFGRIDLPAALFGAEAPDEHGRTTWLCDLVTAVATQLERAGLHPGRVWRAGRCTVSEPEVFHSYRRDGDAAGRMAAGIALA